MAYWLKSPGVTDCDIRASIGQFYTFDNRDNIVGIKMTFMLHELPTASVTNRGIFGWNYSSSGAYGFRMYAQYSETHPNQLYLFAQTMSKKSAYLNIVLDRTYVFELHWTSRSNSYLYFSATITDDVTGDVLWTFTNYIYQASTVRGYPRLFSDNYHQGLSMSISEVTTWGNVGIIEGQDVVIHHVTPKFQDNVAGMYDDVTNTFYAPTSGTMELISDADSRTPLNESTWDDCKLMKWKSISKIKIWHTYDYKIRGYLVKVGSTLYTVVDGALQAISETALDFNTFSQYAVDDMPDADLLLSLTDPTLLYWDKHATDQDSVSRSATLTAYTSPQTLISTPMDIAQISAVTLFSMTYAGTPKFAIKLDDGDYEYYDGTNWQTATGTDGMTPTVALAMTADNWTQKFIGSSVLTIKVILATIDDKVNVIRWKFTAN